MRPAPWAWLLALVVAFLRRGRRRPAATGEEPPASGGPLPAPPGAAPSEGVALGALAVSSLASVAAVAVYVDGADTQLLGLALGLALAGLAVAGIVAGHRLVPQDLEERSYPEPPDPSVADEAAALVTARAGGLSRRRLIAAGAGAGGLLTIALVTPIASIGPSVGSTLDETPWRPGRRLVGVDGEPVSADALDEGAFLTAFPEGVDRRRLDAPLVVVRADPALLHLPPDRADWAPEGYLAFSKTCTHAGCAVGLYRYPLYPERSPGPALVCPCHYSTFDVATGGTVTFGPAGRPLPQLPLAIAPDRTLVAAGPLSGPAGPAWSGQPR